MIDPYRPPAGPYRPGNRGLEYGTAAGDPVRAVADGTVTFAGPVGASGFVVIRHRSGLRSTAAYLDEVLVGRGDSVAAGDRIALASVGFHLTARIGSDYRDPTPLLAGGRCLRARLVPVP
ncbi:MAG: M23 family metallopeptidase [Actinomycetota bacterium]